MLFKNLGMLREKFQAFRRGREEEEYDEKLSQSDNHTIMTPDTASYDVRSQIDMWNPSKFSDEYPRNISVKNSAGNTVEFSSKAKPMVKSHMSSEQV